MGVIFFYKLRQRLQLQQLGDFMFAVKRSQAIFKRHFFNLFHGPKLLKEFYEELSQYTRCHRVLIIPYNFIVITNKRVFGKQ